MCDNQTTSGKIMNALYIMLLGALILAWVSIGGDMKANAVGHRSIKGRITKLEKAFGEQEDKINSIGADTQVIRALIEEREKGK